MNALIMMLVFAVFISSPVLAQSGNSLAKSALGLPEAPVGHRQPSASDVPSASGAERTSMDDLLDKLNREIDSKVNGICRGC